MNESVSPLLPAHIPLWFSSSWLKTGRRDSFIQPEELMRRFILREIFADDGHKSYSDIYPLPLWTSLCICDGDRIDSWQQTPPSVFPPPDTWAVSAPEIREPLLSVWLCNLLSDELSPTWMCSPVLKRCIVGDASAVSITANHFVTGIKSWTWPRVCADHFLKKKNPSFISREVKLLFLTICSVHKHWCTWMWTHTVSDGSVHLGVNLHKGTSALLWKCPSSCPATKPQHVCIQ